MTKAQAWLLAAAHGALDCLNARSTGYRPPHWGPQHEQQAGSYLLAAITAVETAEQQQAQRAKEFHPVDTDVNSPTPPATDSRQLARQLAVAVDGVYHEVYRAEPFTHDDRARLLGLIEHCIARLEPMVHHLIYQYRSTL